MTVEPRVLSQATAEGSKLQPLIKVSVTAQNLKDEQQAKSKRDYQDLFYGGGRPLGCRRHRRLWIYPGTQGIIEVSPGPWGLNSDEERAACNAVLRLMVEVTALRSAIGGVFVPDGSFDAFRHQLSEYGVTTAPSPALNMISAAVVEFDLIAQDSKRRITLAYYGRP